MSTTSLSIKYRPIKIGFLVREGNIEDLVKASGINTLLWGGVYNPIIPVSTTTKDFSKQLLSLFSVDVLFAVSHTTEIDEIIESNQFLRDPNHSAENIFYEDWQTKKNILGYLDSINVVDYYWEHEFKNKPKRYKSNCTLAKWDNSDVCSNLFSILFGYFPTSYNLKDDFLNAFLKGLRSREISVPKDGSVNVDLAKGVTPIMATTMELDGFGGTWRGDGFYIGSENDFSDLLYFWNLRASGLTIEFLPKDHISRFDDFIKTYIKRIDTLPNRNPNIEDWITVYYRGNQDEIKEIIKTFHGKKRFVFSHCDEVIWNGLNIKPADFYFGWQRAMATVEKNYDRYSISASLPDKKFLDTEKDKRGRNIGDQSLVVSIDPIGEFGYPEHTLKPPFIRELNEFYSREIEFNPWRVRSEKGGIGIIIKANDDSLSLYPISHYKLIEKIFELAGFRASTSQAGLLAKQIIHCMREDNPLEACRVFKITGIRKLIGSLKADEPIKWSKAINGAHRFSSLSPFYIAGPFESQGDNIADSTGTNSLQDEFTVYSDDSDNYVEITTTTGSGSDSVYIYYDYADEVIGGCQCQDGIDNDGDGFVDYPNDPGCTSPEDNDEVNTIAALISQPAKILPSLVSSGPGFWILIVTVLVISGIVIFIIIKSDKNKPIN